MSGIIAYIFDRSSPFNYMYCYLYPKNGPNAYWNAKKEAAMTYIIRMPYQFESLPWCDV